MSRLTGDKARFNKNRKRKAAKRLMLRKMKAEGGMGPAVQPAK